VNAGLSPSPAAGSENRPAAHEATTIEDFWATARKELDGLPGDAGLNIAHEAVDRHAAGMLGARRAIRFLKRDGTRRDITYSELSGLTNKFANVLRDLGIGKGDRVFALLGRSPELFITALGSLKNRSIFCSLFSAFGPEPIAARVRIGEAKVLITTKQLYHRKIAPILDQMPSLRQVLIVDGDCGGNAGAVKVVDLRLAIDRASSEFTIEPTRDDDPALLHFTSGTTGVPKGAVHVHGAVIAHHVTGRLALDFHPGDVFWCTADPGWVTGISYGVVAPLTNGITSVVEEAEFDAELWYRTLQDEKVTVWYTAPTAIRMLMRAGDDLASKFDLSNLRFIASVGEPLNPEAVIWSRRVLGIAFHDNWWQTETGGIMIANTCALEVKPGSMGRPLPGIQAAIVEETEDGEVREITTPGAQGELALRPDFPSLFRGYLNQPDRYRECFRSGFYLTGDLAKMDADGYFWFVGRKDDVIKTSGHLVGPFEVESVLLEHAAVAEAGVIGKPDPIAMEVIKGFVSLNPGFEPTESLRRELLGHARRRLGAVVAPKEIEFVDSLPRTRSGKIMRRLLKARELGLPAGDVSALESGSDVLRGEQER
jgi:acetyl-CoA synthetase